MGPGSGDGHLPPPTGGATIPLLVFALSLALLGASDLFFLARAKGFLASGFNSQALSGAGELGGFLLLAVLCDAALLLPLWWALRPLARRFATQPLHELCLVAGLALGLPVLANALLNRVHEVLGNLLALDALFALAGGDAVGAVEEALATSSALALLGSAVAGALILHLGGRRAGRLWPGIGSLPAQRRLFAAALVAVIAGSAAMAFASRVPAWAFGLRWKPSGMALLITAARITDFDLDGVGWVARPSDFAPFDASRQPYALEIPGNGIDEDGWAGDLAAIEAPAVPAPALEPGGPSLVLIFLESFRADLLGKSFRGRDVTPNLDRLAAEGASSRQAFTHSATTWQARAQLLQGQLVPQLDATTLIDDFRGAGYEVAWLSGQHDGLREGARLLGTDRVDHFRDARSRLDERTTPSQRPISLQVSWKSVVEETEQYLQQRDPARPLLLYVNLVDTHFPYDHDRLDDILGGARITRADIRPSAAEPVFEAYLNAVANVDRAIGRILTAVDASLGSRPYSIVVTADHGEAFYEQGFLGHGQSLDRVQSGVPLIVRGIGGRWPEPIGLSDLRGLIRRELPLARPSDRPELRPDPRKRVFQFMGPLDRPKRIALRRQDGVVEFSLTEGRSAFDAARDTELFETWQRARITAAAETAGSPAP